MAERKPPKLGRGFYFYRYQADIAATLLGIALGPQAARGSTRGAKSYEIVWCGKGVRKRPLSLWCCQRSATKEVCNDHPCLCIPVVSQPLMKRRYAFFIAFAAVVLGLLPAAAPHINNNFHVLVEGKGYRSAQPSGAEIRRYFAQYRIATILNLRGASPGSGWYDEEVRTARELGLYHEDFAMSGRQQLAPYQILQLVRLMENAPKPLLIHCEAGADRTGLASALFMVEVAGRSEKEAESELSLRYGHYALPVIGTWEMDLSWEAAEPYIGFAKS